MPDSPRNPFEGVTEEVYDRVIDVHVKGMFFMAQAVYAGMVARGRGKIINLASQLALKGGPDITPYGTAKGAIIGFTRNLAWEAAPLLGLAQRSLVPLPSELPAAFLREVRDGACDLFATVLSPDYNAAHADHFHLDQAARGAIGWRGCR